MSSTSMPISSHRTGAHAGLGPMVRIEMRRFLRHPAFLVGLVLAFGLTLLMWATVSDPKLTDVLSMPVMPAFFIGLPGLIAANRLTRSTDAAVEAVGTAPGREGRRTAALAVACLVPFAAGVVWTAMFLVLVADKGVTSQEWWFATMPDLQVWSILVALGPVACLGGGLLGVLSGRWLHFPGAAAAVVVAVVLVDVVGQLAAVGSHHSALRLWVPWALFTSGTNDDGTQDLYSGNAACYLLYLLCLCAAAALVAIWHDRAARTGQLRLAIAAVVVLGLACLGLSMTTGNGEDGHSDPIPFKVKS